MVSVNLSKSNGEIGRWKLPDVEEQILVEIVGVVVFTSRALKIKDHLVFCKELSILCIEHRVVVDIVI